MLFVPFALYLMVSITECLISEVSQYLHVLPQVCAARDHGLCQACYSLCSLRLFVNFTLPLTFTFSFTSMFPPRPYLLHSELPSHPYFPHTLSIHSTSTGEEYKASFLSPESLLSSQPTSLLPLPRWKQAWRRLWPWTAVRTDCKGTRMRGKCSWTGLKGKIPPPSVILLC